AARDPVQAVTRMRRGGGRRVPECGLSRLVQNPIGKKDRIARLIACALGVAALLTAGTRSADCAGVERGLAVVLGGGGPVGEAWESGVLVGLAESGIDMSRADVIIGTSAGAIVGARIASRMPRADIIHAALARSDGSKRDAPPPAASGTAPDL